MKNIGCYRFTWSTDRMPAKLYREAVVSESYGGLPVVTEKEVVSESSTIGYCLVRLFFFSTPIRRVNKMT